VVVSDRFVEREGGAGEREGAYDEAGAAGECCGSHCDGCIVSGDDSGVGTLSLTVPMSREAWCGSCVLELEIGD
jgi:hypothetical protein